MKISGEEIWLNTKTHPAAAPPAQPQAAPASRRPEAAQEGEVPGEWAGRLDGNSICSYPPEDLVIEDYGRFLKKKGKSILSEERAAVEPFTTSLLDGIDIRETIRNWHEGKIYVRKFAEGSRAKWAR